MEILSFKNFSFTHRGASDPAVKNIDLTVNGGEILLLYGENGCGKTTLLSLIKQETAPKGECSGELLRGFAPGDAGLVMQNPEMQIVTDRVWHELAFACENRGWSRERIRQRVGETAAYFGLEAIFRRDTASLSGGQKQLLNLAAATVTGPRLLLLDEPTAQLDPLSAESFMNTVRRMNRELGITFILCEHNTENVFSMADRVAYMEGGVIKAVLPPREIGQKIVKKPMFGGLPCAVRIGAELGTPVLTNVEARELIGRYSGPKRSDKKPAGPMGEPIMELKNVSFRYEQKAEDVLRSVSLELKKGEIFSILGGNGAGKSTLLSVMAGLRAATGKVLYKGKKLKDYGSALYRGNIAMLPQNPQDCFVSDSLKGDFDHMAEVCGYGDYAGLTERLGLTGKLSSHPYDLSGGEQQRAALGKVLMTGPELLLLDEPGKGLDAVGKAELVRILRSLAEEGKTVVIVTHDTELAAKLSDRCALLFDGEIISVSPPEEFFGSNIFLTTPAARISRGIFENAVTAEKIVELCSRRGAGPMRPSGGCSSCQQKNGVKNE